MASYLNTYISTNFLYYLYIQDCLKCILFALFMLLIYLRLPLLHRNTNWYAWWGTSYASYLPRLALLYHNTRYACMYNNIIIILYDGLLMLLIHLRLPRLHHYDTKSCPYTIGSLRHCIVHISYNKLLLCHSYNIILHNFGLPFFCSLYSGLYTKVIHFFSITIYVLDIQRTHE